MKSRVSLFDGLSSELDLGSVVARQNRWPEAEALDREGLASLTNFVERGDDRNDRGKTNEADSVLREHNVKPIASNRTRP